VAGIGFRLQKLLQKGTYFGVLQGFFFATFLIVGPWVTSIITIFVLNHFTKLLESEFFIFRTTLVYLYSFSLIFTGFYQMPLTRYLADELYLEKEESIAPSFLGMTIIIAVLQGLFGMIIAWNFPLSTAYRMLFVGGLVTVSLIWLAMIYLGILRDYFAISFIFIVGSVISCVGAIFLQHFIGLEGYLFGFVSGQALIFGGLTYRIIQELSIAGIKPRFGFLKCFSLFPEHFVIGFTFNLGSWIDKMLFWWSPLGESACQGLYSYRIYDTGMFLSYLTVIPALALFLMNIETSFYRVYRNFYAAISAQQALSTIRHCWNAIYWNLRFNLFEMIKIQGTLTFTVYYFAPEILTKLNYPGEILPMLRWGVLGSFFQTLFLATILILLYFDFRKDAMIANLTFLLCNLTGTLITIMFRDSDWYGIGYFMSAIFCFLLAARLLYTDLKDLLFITFMGQPIPGEKPPTPPIVGSDERLGEISFIQTHDKTDSSKHLLNLK